MGVDDLGQTDLLTLDQSVIRCNRLLSHLGIGRVTERASSTLSALLSC